MSRTSALIDELLHEAATTRRHLERLTDDRWDWRPHEKSFTAGDLASHLVECVQLGESVYAQDVFDFDPATFTPFRAGSSENLLAAFDAAVASAERAMRASADADATGTWTLSVGGKPFFEKPREAAFRDMALAHLVHHRGQFSVYLRLLDVPVPASYGPSADEQVEMPA